MPDRYSNAAARAQGPDCDDSIPEHALARIAELERLARELYRAAGEQRLRGVFMHPSRLSSDLERRACELLDLDPPGFDPATEGP